MKIGIIGAGSIGLLCAFQLNKRFEVTLYARTAEQVKEIKNKGITYIRENEKEHAYIPVEIVDHWKGMEDLTIVTVKQYQLSSVLSKIEAMKRNINGLLFLQNGMGHVEKIMPLATFPVYVGVVEHGALRMNVSTVQHLGTGIIRIGKISKVDSQAAIKMVKANIPFFPFQMEADYLEMLQKKLVVNSVINPLTSILSIKNGDLLKNPYYAKLLPPLMEEIAAILALTKKEKQAYLTYVYTIIEKTAENTSSMREDIQENRQTEVNAILGFLMEKAKQNGVEAPLIKSYYHMVLGIEQIQKGGRS